MTGLEHCLQRGLTVTFNPPQIVRGYPTYGCLVEKDGEPLFGFFADVAATGRHLDRELNRHLKAWIYQTTQYLNEVFSIES